MLDGEPEVAAGQVKLLPLDLVSAGEDGLALSGLLLEVGELLDFGESGRGRIFFGEELPDVIGISLNGVGVSGLFAALEGGLDDGVA